MKQHTKSRNWYVTIFAFAAAVFTAWGAYVCWVNLNQDGFMWGAAVGLTITSSMLWIATLTGKAKDFFLALISWW